MTATRGDRIRTERERQRLSREDLAAHTGVNAKTIARIERGEVASSPSTPRLEDYLGIPHASSRAAEHKEWPREELLAALRASDDLDLISELAQRLVARRDPAAPEPLGPEGYYRWYTRDAPYPEPGNTDTASDDGVADSGGPA